jgi:predicted RNA binding protein YcfA (HicA-like mRNA interferase family)
MTSSELASQRPRDTPAKRVRAWCILRAAGWELLRHGAHHDINRNPANDRRAPVPRHTEIADTLVAQILKQLGIEGE